MIGASADDDNGDHSGSAYVFRYDGSSWVDEAKLLAPPLGELPVVHRGQIIAEDVRRPERRPSKSAQAVEERGLAAAGSAFERDEATGFDLQVQPSQRRAGRS